MVNLEELGVDALAAARITRLVTQDTITETLRKRFVARVLNRAAHGDRWRTEKAQEPDDIDDWFDAYELTTGEDVPKLAVLVTCPWCVGVYVAVGVSVARRVAPRVWGPLARGLAVAQLAGVIDTH